jgi:DNA-binding GntR family transcriptional regulator
MYCVAVKLRDAPLAARGPGGSKAAASRTHYAAQQIAEAIITGALRPGDQVAEEEWAAMLSVSRVPVREALRKLETEGLVEIRPRRGAFVAGMERADVTEIYDVRALLEGFAARLCTFAIRPKALGQMDDLLTEMRVAAADGQPDRYGQLSVAFQEIIWENVPNRVVRELIRRLGRRSLRLRLISWRLPGYVEASLAASEDLLEALRNRDPNAAEMIRWLQVQRAKRALLNGYFGRPDQRAALEKDLPAPRSGTSRKTA